MNGIIHPCARGQGGMPNPTSEDEIYENIFNYTDKIMRIARPKKILYLAIDGVAPRAKLNQQRSRRFRSAIEAEEKDKREQDLREHWGKKTGQKNEEADVNTFHFDSNVITPGTEFMHRLAKALRGYVLERTNNDEVWQGLTVIFSDAFVPGEGEHKILDFIRSQRASEKYDANTRHCILGADADLIMLGLSTHEAHFYIMREAFFNPNDRTCHKCR